MSLALLYPCISHCLWSDPQTILSQGTTSATRPGCLLGILHPTADAGKHPEACGSVPDSKVLNFLCVGKDIP